MVGSERFVPGEKHFLTEGHKHQTATRVRDRVTDQVLHILVTWIVLFDGHVLVRTEALPNSIYVVGKGFHYLCVISTKNTYPLMRNRRGKQPATRVRVGFRGYRVQVRKQWMVLERGHILVLMAVFPNSIYSPYRVMCVFVGLFLAKRHKRHSNSS